MDRITPGVETAPKTIRRALAAVAAAAVALMTFAVIPAPPAGASLSFCRFGVGQAFDTQWSYNSSTKVLNVHGLTTPFHQSPPNPSGGQIAGLTEGDYFEFYETTANGSPTYGLRLFTSSGGLKETVAERGTFVAAGHDFIFYNQQPGSNGTLFTTQASYRYGDSASFQGDVSSPSFAYMRDVFSDCYPTPIPGGGLNPGSGPNPDRTPPTISGTATPSPNAAGWHNGPVTIEWTCSDEQSGVAVCPAPTVLTVDGAAQSVTMTVTDRAGNVGSTTVDGINIDQTAPKAKIDTQLEHPTGTGGRANDNLSGVEHVEVTYVNLATGRSDTVLARCPGCTATSVSWFHNFSKRPGTGQFRVSSRAFDLAGNVSEPSREVSYLVLL